MQDTERVERGGLIGGGFAYRGMQEASAKWGDNDPDTKCHVIQLFSIRSEVNRMLGLCRHHVT